MHSEGMRDSLIPLVDIGRSLADMKARVGHGSPGHASMLVANAIIDLSHQVFNSQPI